MKLKSLVGPTVVALGLWLLANLRLVVLLSRPEHRAADCLPPLLGHAPNQFFFLFFLFPVAALAATKAAALVLLEWEQRPSPLGRRWFRLPSARLVLYVVGVILPAVIAYFDAHSSRHDLFELVPPYSCNFSKAISDVVASDANKKEEERLILGLATSPSPCPGLVAAHDSADSRRQKLSAALAPDYPDFCPGSFDRTIWRLSKLSACCGLVGLWVTLFAIVMTLRFHVRFKDKVETTRKLVELVFVAIAMYGFWIVLAQYNADEVGLVRVGHPDLVSEGIFVAVLAIVVGLMAYKGSGALNRSRQR